MRRKLGALIAALVLAVSGCAMIPTSGDPEAFTIEAPSRGPVYQTASGPRPGSTPDQLIADFLRACQAGAGDDYQTARQYLSPEAAADWQPESAALIYAVDRGPQTLSEDGNTITLSLRTRGSLDADGILSAADDSETKVTFGVAKGPDGEWRINELDDGVILSQSSFATAFQAVQLYFLTPSQDSLVPDPRWFPRKRLSSHLVNGLIAGPSAELEDAVYTALNPSFSLPTQGIELSEDQVVRVSLVGEAPEGEAVKEHMAWQIGATLAQVPSTTGVEIEVNGVALPVTEPPFGPVLRLDRAVGVRGGQIVQGESEVWTGTGIILGDDAGNPAIGPVLDAPIAWTDGDSVRVRVGLEELSFDVAHPLPPVVDRWGWVWTAPGVQGQSVHEQSADSKDPQGEGSEGELLAFGPQGQQVSFPVDFASPTALSAIAAAPDGVRMALISSASKTLTVHVVVRDSSGTPQQLNPGVVQWLPEDATDVAWAGATSLAVLVGGAEAPQVAVLPLAGFVQLSTAPEGVTSITAGSGPTRIYLQEDDGMLYAKAGALWRPIGNDVAQVRFPG